MGFSKGTALKSMAWVGHLPTQKPQPVHLSMSMTGLNIPLNSMASSMQGSLHEKQMTPLCATQPSVEMTNVALSFSDVWTLSKESTLGSQAELQSSQKVQPLLEKFKAGVPSSSINIISSSQEATHDLLSHATHSL
jgi:hypothetical protein